MPCNYQELEVIPLRAATALCQPEFLQNGKVVLEDPATTVMTDLTTVASVTISPSSSLNEATVKMINMNVKLLFVTNVNNRVIGLLTNSDLQGERPIQFQQMNGVSRAEILALDIMTGIDQIDALDFSAVEKAKVGDMAMTMKNLHRQHALVVEEKEGIRQIRGIFSTTNISKLLGVQIDTFEVAATFADLGKILGCN
jgi:CBS-domain-containing membrane protein